MEGRREEERRDELQLGLHFYFSLPYQGWDLTHTITEIAASGLMH
jgi:hypothetical protein